MVTHERHSSKEALEAGLGTYDGINETFAQLDELVASLGANPGRS